MMHNSNPTLKSVVMQVVSTNKHIHSTYVFDYFSFIYYNAPGGHMKKIQNLYTTKYYLNRILYPTTIHFR